MKNPEETYLAVCRAMKNPEETFDNSIVSEIVRFLTSPKSSIEVDIKAYNNPPAKAECTIFKSMLRYEKSRRNI